MLHNWLISYQIGNTVTAKDGTVRTLERTHPSDPDHVAMLCNEVGLSQSVLVFCPTKKSVENCASMLADNTPHEENQSTVCKFCTAY